MVPSAHNFLATLFSKILSEVTLYSLHHPFGVRPRFKLLFKGGGLKQPSNFQPIVLISTVGKLFHKILVIRLERDLYSNDLIDTSAQMVFFMSINGMSVSVSAILDNALLHYLPLADFLGMYPLE